MMRATGKLLITVLIVALMAFPSALAWQDGGTYEITAEALPDIECQVSGPLDNDTALQGYFESLLGIGGSGLFTPRNLGGDLSGLEKLLYDYLEDSIADVAAGQQASTAFEVPLSYLGADVEGKQYTAEDLGVDEVITYSSGTYTVNSQANTVMRQRIYNQLGFTGDTLTIVVRTLLWDHPYEMYWFNKKVNVTATLPISGNYITNTLYYKGFLRVRFTPSDDYVAGSFLVDTEKTGAASAAAANASTIVQQYANASDYDKLVGFKETICDLTDYNSAAIENEASYGDPWQVIWVFDGDPETTVVCEGYAKAFQYLCDMTDFDDDAITCYCVSGKMNEGDHMWNIVQMPNGLNYQVDLTNCDTHADGTRGVGAPDKLFMVGCANGNADLGYTFVLGSNNNSYVFTYKDTTLRLFSNSELTLSTQSYIIDTALAIDETSFPDEAFRTCVLSLCDTDGNALLDRKEVAAAEALDVSGNGIASLAGIEYLTALRTLDCKNNRLPSLDDDLIPRLSTLYCEGNPLTSLDISGNAGMVQMLTPEFRTVFGDVKIYTSDTHVLSCDLGVRLITGLAPAGTLTLPGGLTEICESAFEAVAAERVVVPGGCTAIGARAFADSPNLSEVFLPASVTTIADDAFDGSPDVFIISPSASVRQWAASQGINSAAN